MALETSFPASWLEGEHHDSCSSCFGEEGNRERMNLNAQNTRVACVHALMFFSLHTLPVLKMKLEYICNGCVNIQI